jgi:hypothetical protein
LNHWRTILEVISVRKGMLIATGVAVVIAVLTVVHYLRLPSYMVPVLVMITLMALLFWLQRQQLKLVREAAAEPAPELEARIRVACARFGRPDLGVALVTGAGRSVLRLQGGTMLVSPAAGKLMDDEELNALVLQELAYSSDQATRRAWIDILGVPVAALAVFGGASLLTGLPLVGAGFLVVVAWLLVYSQTGLLTRRTARRMFEAYLGRGGDPVPFVRAVVKLYTEVCRADPQFGRAATLKPMHLHLRQLVTMAGMPAEQLAAIGDAVGAPLELIAPERLPLGRRMAMNRLIIYSLIWVASLIISIVVALSLSNGQ